jgi:hypothetical protein
MLNIETALFAPVYCLSFYQVFFVAICHLPFFLLQEGCHDLRLICSSSLQADCQGCTAKANLSLWFAGGLPGLHCKSSLVFVVCRRVARRALQKLTSPCGLQADCQACAAKVNLYLWFAVSLPGLHFKI